jgi:hypothetical protein
MADECAKVEESPRSILQISKITMADRSHCYHNLNKMETNILNAQEDEIVKFKVFSAKNRDNKLLL